MLPALVFRGTRNAVHGFNGRPTGRYRYSERGGSRGLRWPCCSMPHDQGQGASMPCAERSSAACSSASGHSPASFATLCPWLTMSKPRMHAAICCLTRMSGHSCELMVIHPLLLVILGLLLQNELLICHCSAISTRRCCIRGQSANMCRAEPLGLPHSEHADRASLCRQLYCCRQCLRVGVRTDPLRHVKSLTRSARDRPFTHFFQRGCDCGSMSTSSTPSASFLFR